MSLSTLQRPRRPHGSQTMESVGPRFNLQGKQVTQTGAVFTVALRKLTKDWRIAAWAWAKGQAA
jgi:hypothetical protein